MTDADPIPETPERLNMPLCAECGWPADAEVLADTPECPHGWLSLEGMPIADVKALFAAGAPELSLDPVELGELGG